MSWYLYLFNAIAYLYACCVACCSWVRCHVVCFVGVCIFVQVWEVKNFRSTLGVVLVVVVVVVDLLLASGLLTGV